MENDRFVQSYKILRKKQEKEAEKAIKTVLKRIKTGELSSMCTKMAVFFTIDKNKKCQKNKKMLTIPYIYDKIFSLSARRSERLLQMSYCYGV